MKLISGYKTSPKYQNIWKNQYFKGATTLYFMYYFRVVIILFSTGLYKSAFFIYGFGVSVSLDFNF